MLTYVKFGKVGHFSFHIATEWRSFGLNITYHHQADFARSRMIEARLGPIYLGVWWPVCQKKEGVFAG